VVDIETRINGWFLAREVQFIKKGSLDSGHVQVQGLGPVSSGKKKANLASN
jgi:hypothetical protein